MPEKENLTPPTPEPSPPDSVAETIAAIEARYAAELAAEKSAHEKTKQALDAANKLLRDSINGKNAPVNDMDEKIKKFIR